MEAESDEDRQSLRDLVRRGYDTISHRYRDDLGAPNSHTAESTANYKGLLGELAELLQPGARVLDLGCGAGLPTARLLVDAGFNVTGVDISAVQIQRARSLVPRATFIQADMATWDSAPDTFDAVVSLYALIHVPLIDQQQLIPRIARWLSPRGYLLAIVGHQRWTGVEEYMGARMFWDHADTATYLAWFEDAGLSIRWHRYIPDGTSGHTLVLAETG